MPQLRRSLPDSRLAGWAVVGQRAGEVVALPVLAAQGDQVGGLLGLLDALGHGVQLEDE